MNRSPDTLFRDISQWRGMTFDTAVEQDLAREKRKLFIFASNKFEGSSWDKGNTFKLIEQFESKDNEAILSELSTDATPSQREIPPSRREVLQHYVACRLLCDSAPQLTESLIQMVHATLSKGLLDEDNRPIPGGQYRTDTRLARHHVFIPPEFVPPSMTRLVADYNQYEPNKSIDTCLLAAWLMCEFVSIHPFNDCNGRMCRLLFNYVLHRRGWKFYVPLADKHYLKILEKYQSGRGISIKMGTIWSYSVERVHSYLANLVDNQERVNAMKSKKE